MPAIVADLPLPGCPFGHALRAHWSLDPAVHFLNHGSYGATPRCVLAAQARWRDAMEREPVRFMVDELPGAWLAAAGRLARFTGATPSRLALVENATAGANAVLRSLRWRQGERIVIANHAYPALRNTARFIAERHGLDIVEAQVPWPLPGPDAVIGAYVNALAGGARVAIVDHVFSPLAVALPPAALEAIVAACKARGASVLVDGAHAPGLVPLELDRLGAAGVDWYIGNCHKWLCAPKGSGFLYATEAAQQDLHPAVISNFHGESFQREFAWTGTGDPTARLAIPAALDVIEALGAERYRTALRTLAREAAAMLSDAWDVAPGAPPELFAAMVTLPLPVGEPATPASIVRWRLQLLDEHRVEVPVIAIDGRHWVRISAQVYNELDDYAALARAFAPAKF